MVNVMQTGAEFGMQTLDQALIGLFRRGLISLEETLIRCKDPEVAKKSLARSVGR